MEAVDRRAHLERVLEVLWMAFDGARLLQNGEKVAFSESAAPLAREIRATVAELAGLGVEQVEVNPADDIATRRAARRAGSADPAFAPRRSQPRRSNGSHRAS